jgi:hypothetical protein
MIAERFSSFLSPLPQLHSRWLIRLFAGVSTLYGFWIIYDMDHYLPWQVRFFRAVELTLLGHCGLWLATYDWKRWARVLVSIVFFPSLLGIAILWWHVHLAASAVVLAWMGWRWFELLKGPPHGVESV